MVWHSAQWSHPESSLPLRAPTGSSPVSRPGHKFSHPEPPSCTSPSKTQFVAPEAPVAPLGTVLAHDQAPRLSGRVFFGGYRIASAISPNLPGFTSNLCLCSPPSLPPAASPAGISSLISPSIWQRLEPFCPLRDLRGPLRQVGEYPAGLVYRLVQVVRQVDGPLPTGHPHQRIRTAEEEVLGGFFFLRLQLRIAVIRASCSAERLSFGRALSDRRSSVSRACSFLLFLLQLQRSLEEELHRARPLCQRQCPRATVCRGEAPT